MRIRGPNRWRYRPSKKNPRAVYGPNFIEKIRSRAAVEMTV